MTLAQLAVWHASAIEIIWTAIGLTGVGIGTSNLLDSKKKAADLEKMNGKTFERYQIMRIVANGHYRNDLFRLSKHLVITFIGIIAMILPPAPGSNAHHVSALGAVVTMGFFAIAVLILLASVLDKRQREVLEKL